MSSMADIEEALTVLFGSDTRYTLDSEVETVLKPGFTVYFNGVPCVLESTIRVTTTLRNLMVMRGADARIGKAEAIDG